MSREPKKVQWTRAETPKKAGRYVVAIEHECGLGAYDFSYWSPLDGWEIKDQSGKIVAFIDFDDVAELLPYAWEDEA
ncbi:hypothetical protein BTA51_29460 [Hahella sp. CCB-MM4]|uniref:hypothetical protein n=1 Tax=Hahella sp. (strain CCB-MM4) TaxID=1926491 RepID=UPI000B9C0D78|nr:hypothetical protein [Hahella sp. CCB-MM4]OZG69753.1 hypothetical protein BTA51_29460 [Hahella sp. CCB-MM4]